MVLTEILLSCLTIIEFLNLLIRVIKIITILRVESLDEPPKEPGGTSFPSASDLTEEMRAKIYS